jgi:hypothetical protein
MVYWWSDSYRRGEVLSVRACIGRCWQEGQESGQIEFMMKGFELKSGHRKGEGRAHAKG